MVRVIEKIEPARITPWEELPGVVPAALTLLAMLSAIVIVAGGGFADPRLAHNGWVRLLTLAITIGVFAWSLRISSPRRARRMQLAVLVSLIFHVVLVSWFQWVNIFFVAEREARPPVLQLPPEPIPLPEKILQPQETEEQPEFERPVQSQVAEAPETTTDRAQQTLDKASRQPVEMPDPQPQQLTAAAMRQPDTSVPRRAPQLAKLSRRELPTPEPLADLGNTPGRQTTEPVERPLTPTATTLQRRRDSLPEPVSRQRQALSAKLPAPERRQQESQQPAATDATLARTAPRPAATQENAQASPSLAAAESNKPAPAATPVEVARRPAQPTINVQRRDREAEREPATETLTAQAPRQSAEVSPNLNEVSPQTRRVQPAAAEAVARQLATTTAPENSPATQQQEPAPASSAGVIARRDQQRIEEPAPSNATLPAAVAAVVTRADARRPPDQDQPILQDSPATSRNRLQALAAAAEAATPARADRPSLAQNSSPLRPAASTAAAALERATRGFVGGADSPNASQGERADQRRSAPFASAAARRPVASQQRAGPALTPTAPARIARSTAGAESPRSPVQAQSSSTSRTGGSTQPSRLAASASAAIERQDANAPLGDITAAAGANAIDTGSEQIVANDGSARASGGGQPQLTVAAAIPRRRQLRAAGGAPQPALDVTAQAAVPSAPAAAAAVPRAAQRPQATGTAEQIRRTRGRGVVPVVNQALAAAAGMGAAAAAESRRSTAATAARQSTAAPPRRGPPQTDEAMAAAADSGSSAAQPVAANASSGGGSRSGGGPRQATSAAPPNLSVASAPAARRRAAAAVVAIPADVLVASDQPGSAATAPTTASTADNTPQLNRRDGGLNVAIEAPAGSGGLGRAASVVAGINDRRAKPRSELLSITAGRFLDKRSGAIPTATAAARMPAPAFAERSKRRTPQPNESDPGPGAKTEAAIELGLTYLATLQREDGSWLLSRNGVDLQRAPRERPKLESPTAATGLALLAFLGGGYDHFGEKYSSEITAGLQLLVARQQPDGDLYIPQKNQSDQFNRFYSHGIATLALCEAFGMTGDPALRKPAENALQFIINMQHPEYGGWRYTVPAQGGVSDLSVSGWQVMALKSGELAGLQVPAETYQGVRRLVDQCRVEDSNRTLYCYNPWADPDDARRRHHSRASTVMTSVGLLMELYLGRNRDDPLLRRGAEHLLANLPQFGRSRDSAAIGTIENPLRDTYYWYYATQVMFHMRGEYWDKWNAQLHPQLINTQTRIGRLAGSWNPTRPTPDQWSDEAGRLYITAMNLLSLEVYYRHLPLYEETAR